MSSKITKQAFIDSSPALFGYVPLGIAFGIISFQKTQSLWFINTDTILDKRINAYSLSKSQFKEWMSFGFENVKFTNIALEHFFGPFDTTTKFV